MAAAPASATLHDPPLHGRTGCLRPGPECHSRAWELTGERRRSSPSCGRARSRDGRTVRYTRNASSCCCSPRGRGPYPAAGTRRRHHRSRPPIAYQDLRYRLIGPHGPAHGRRRRHPDAAERVLQGVNNGGGLEDRRLRPHLGAIFDGGAEQGRSRHRRCRHSHPERASTVGQRPKACTAGPWRGDEDESGPPPPSPSVGMHERGGTLLDVREFRRAARCAPSVT